MVRVAATAIGHRCIAIIRSRSNHFRNVVVVRLDHAASIHRIVMRRRAHNHRIANGQHEEEFLNALRLLRVGFTVARLQHVLAQFGVDDDRRCRCARLRVSLLQLGRCVIVVDAIDRAFAKQHFIFGQRARLIGEYVLHLAQFFGDVHRPTFGPPVRLHIEQIRVVVDVKDLQYFAKLDGHVQRQRNHHLQNNDERPKCDETLVVSIEIQGQKINGLALERDQPHAAPDRTDHTQNQ